MKGRQRGARVLLVVAGLAASLAFSSWIATRTVLDPTNTKALANKLLATPAVHDHLADQATDGLDSQLADQLGNPATVARLKRAVDQALRDPRFTAAFAGAIAQLHAALMSSQPHQVDIDPRAFSTALQRALAPTDPTLAKAVATSEPVTIQIGSDKMPSLKGARDTASLVVVLGALVACLLIAGALALDHSRKMVGRLGRRLAYLAIVPIAVFVVVPMLIDAHGDAGQVVGVVLRSYRGRVLPVTFVVIGAGVAVALGAWCWPRPRPPLVPDTAPAQPADHLWPDMPSPLAHAAAPEIPDRITAS